MCFTVSFYFLTLDVQGVSFNNWRKKQFIQWLKRDLPSYIFEDTFGNHLTDTKRQQTNAPPSFYVNNFEKVANFEDPDPKVLTVEESVLEISASVCSSANLDYLRPCSSAIPPLCLRLIQFLWQCVHWKPANRDKL